MTPILRTSSTKYANIFLRIFQKTSHFLLWRKPYILSPYYVSKMFKKVTGEKFIVISHSVRMEKAMELLSSCDSRIYEVAERVGYKSTKHFSQVFRTYTGKTPFEYKKSACGNDEA